MAEARSMVILRNEPLSRWTGLAVGGPAEALCLPRNADHLAEALAWADSRNLPVAVIGGGFNVLAADEGFPGLVIVMGRGFDSLEVRPDGQGVMVSAGAGLKLSRLVRRAAAEGWAGLAFLAGIPGTVGGAAVMNAGAWGRSMDGQVTGLTGIDGKGRVFSRQRAELDYDYRRLELEPDAVVTGVGLASTLAPAAEVAVKVDEYLARRRDKQPLSAPSAGSFFKNPANDHAGRLIEAAGLKGRVEGGAMVSEVHANFIINRGGAKAGDIIRLARLIRQQVQERHGVVLEPEVRLLGQGKQTWAWL